MVYALLLLLVTLFTGAQAADSTKTVRVSIDQWLVAGPYAVTLPVFSDTAHVSADALLAADAPDITALEPREGEELHLAPGRTLTWARQHTREFNWPDSPVRPGAVYTASYFTLPATEEILLHVSSAKEAAFTVYLDGKAIDEKPAAEGEALSLKSKHVLHHGKHLLIIKSACAASGMPWTLKATLSPTEESGAISISTTPRRAPTQFTDNALFDNVSSPALSANGKWIAFVRSHRAKDLTREAWIEIWDAKSSKLSRTLRPLKSPDNLYFLPKSDKLAFTAANDGKSTVWMLNLESGELAPVVKDIVGLQRVVYSPDENFLYYTADAEKSHSDTEPELWTALEDRMSDWTNTRQLYALSLKDGSSHAITATGEFAVDEFALSREGDKLIFTRRIPQTGRPYYSTEFWTYRLSDGKAERILASPIPWERRPLSLTWLPGGDQIVYTASRFMIEKGDTTTPGFAPGGLWMLDLRTGKLKNLSLKEDFSAAEDEGRSALLWNTKEKNLWFKAMVGGKLSIFKTDPLAANPKFTEVPLKFPFIGDFDLAANGQCLFTASDPVTPQALYLADAPGRASKQIVNPAKDVLPNLELATVDRWNFTDAQGYSIDGWLYYPPDFSSDKKWPLVVYYYGGTYPRDERFSFTYHWWAANGYVVYVLNPVGAMGYGDKFAAILSNDWGTLATQDIIEGTRKLVAAKPFIDSTKMAAYGGSYGGFITMDLATKTNMFAALVSDAGISDITSYFGGGTWGFTYGDIALPNSFPWTRPDIFMGKSPVYHADKIRTPLLLIHGLDDDNVPPIESAEMFTALKVLGRDVAFARYPGEDHSIAIKFSDLVDYREVMLAWFDKYLKGQSAAWNDRWKK